MEPKPSPWSAVVELLCSRKFNVMLLGQLALVAPTVAGKLNVEFAAAIGTAFATVWMVMHSVEVSAKAKADASVDAVLAAKDEPTVH